MTRTKIKSTVFARREPATHVICFKNVAAMKTGFSQKRLDFCVKFSSDYLIQNLLLNA